MTLILATSVGCSGGDTLRIEVSPVKMDCKDIPVKFSIIFLTLRGKIL